MSELVIVGAGANDSQEAARVASNQFVRCSWPYRRRDASHKYR